MGPVPSARHLGYSYQHMGFGLHDNCCLPYELRTSGVDDSGITAANRADPARATAPEEKSASMAISGLYLSYMVVGGLLLWRRCTGGISSVRSSDKEDSNCHVNQSPCVDKNTPDAGQMERAPYELRTSLCSMAISGLYLSYMVVGGLLLWRRCTGGISSVRRWPWSRDR
jgi:hypothetical protein